MQRRKRITYTEADNALMWVLKILISAGARAP